MMKRENFQIAQIYVPVKRRTTLVQARVAGVPVTFRCVRVRERVGGP